MLSKPFPKAKNLCSNPRGPCLGWDWSPWSLGPLSILLVFSIKFQFMLYWLRKLAPPKDGVFLTGPIFILLSSCDWTRSTFLISASNPCLFLNKRSGWLEFRCLFFLGMDLKIIYIFRPIVSLTFGEILSNSYWRSWSLDPPIPISVPSFRVNSVRSSF